MYLKTIKCEDKFMLKKENRLFPNTQKCQLAEVNESVMKCFDFCKEEINPSYLRIFWDIFRIEDIGDDFDFRNCIESLGVYIKPTNINPNNPSVANIFLCTEKINTTAQQYYILEKNLFKFIKEHETAHLYMSPEYYYYHTLIFERSFYSIIEEFLANLFALYALKTNNQIDKIILFVEHQPPHYRSALSLFHRYINYQFVIRLLNTWLLYKIGISPYEKNKFNEYIDIDFFERIREFERVILYNKHSLNITITLLQQIYNISDYNIVNNIINRLVKFEII